METALWASILSVAGVTSLNGFSRASYLSYVLWATFVARVTANWSYEFEMADEIESGRINAILLRPISFYEYYLSQFLGYKLSTVPFSLLCPFIATLIFPTTVILNRILPMLVLIFFYLFFVHTLSFCISCCGFFMTRTSGITVTKNMSLWMLSGELFPLDLIPAPMKGWVINLPFAAGVYVPVGFLTGRLGWDELLHAFASVTIGLMAVSLFAALVWRRGLRVYSGIGA